MSHEDDWYLYELLTVAQSMHSASTGCADMPPEEEAQRMLSWMRMRLAGWSTARGVGVGFDACVRALCEIAAAEFAAALDRTSVAVEMPIRFVAPPAALAKGGK